MCHFLLLHCVVFPLQHICVALWNVCLPLLQHNLRHLLSKPLTELANALEDMQRYVRTQHALVVCSIKSSLLYELRLTAHLELAKICSQSHQLQAALDHLHKVWCSIRG